MVHLYRYIILIISLCTTQLVSAYGLRFRGAASPIDERTSYDVFAHSCPSFKDYFDLEFNMALYSTESVGYVLRVKGADEGQIFNLFFDFRGDDILFRLNQEGKCVLIALPVSKAEAMKSHWFKVKIAFNLKQDEITLKIHDQEKVCKGVLLSDEFSPKIVFGKSDHIIDVPEIAVDKLVVNAEHTYTFPLDEADGESVCNQEGTLYGKVENPIWLINEAYHWRKEGGFASASEAGSCYNADRNEIYYFNRDSLFVYNMETGSTSAKAFAERCPVKLFLAGSFFDSGSERLYAYEVYTENGDSEPMIASLDLHTLGWRVESYSRLSMQLHHHCSYYDAVRKRYTIFGGFGNMYYSNKFYMFNAEEERWNTLGSLSGDFLCPRYFSSAGYLDSNHSVYIFGGMGNESGDQVIGRRYFHDFYKVDLQEMRVQKLWDISEGQPNMVPAQDMVILNDSCFYVLRYPESVSNSFLHLYRFSVEDGSCHILGDSIPIYSDKITTNARLYYNERQSRLFVTVQETSDDVSSKFSVYSLLFPPVSLEKYTANNGGGNASHVWLVLVAAVVAVAGGSVWIVYKRHRNSGKGEDGKAVRQDKEQLPEASDVKVEKMAVDTGTVNSMYLFGDFSVFDRNGRNISYMFSLRIKQIFCLILRYSDADGISSKQLSDLIWPDKPKDKVKNSRGVAINHLRKILKELDGIELVYEKGCFRFTLSSDFYCDYLRFMAIVAENRIEECRQEFLYIVGRGKFVGFMDGPLFDGFKQDVECLLEVLVLQLMKEAFEAQDYAETVSLAEAEFNIDPVNETALSCCLKSLFILKHENAAIGTYQKFVAEYKKYTGGRLSSSFQSLLELVPRHVASGAFSLLSFYSSVCLFQLVRWLLLCLINVYKSKSF